MQRIVLCYDYKVLKQPIIRLFAGRRLEVVAFVVGVVVLAFELIAARIIAPYLGTTIFTWTSIIGVILAALAAGYSLGGIWGDKRHDAVDVVYLLLASALLLSIMNLLKDWLLGSISSAGGPLQLQGLTASLLLFALPTMLLGAVSPYLARLSITDVTTSGQKLSRISAAGTVGSLVGTFLTGYVLFGFFGTNALLISLAICLVAASFLLERQRLLWLRLGLAVIALVLGHWSSQPHLSGFVKSIDTAYSRVIIRNVDFYGRSVKALQTANDGSQSGIYNDGSPDLAFSYTRGFAYQTFAQPKAHDFLVIGGGAFTFPEFLARNVQDSKVDTVEIDPQLIGISKADFKFRQSPNHRIITADGRQYLNCTKDRYDMIFVDAFSSAVPPFQLITKQAVDKMHQALNKDGTVVANFIAFPTGNHSGLIHFAYSTFRTSFSNVRVYQTDPQVDTRLNQNVLLVASNHPDDAVAEASVRQIYPEFDRMLRAPVSYTADKRQILTDDYAPVEQLTL